MASKPRKGSVSSRPKAASPRRHVARSHGLDDDLDEIHDYRRERRPSLIKTVIAGREHEFGGIALVCLGIVLCLSIYLHVAGPLGRGLDTMFAFFLGLGRFIAPIGFIAGGIALMKRATLEHRIRVTFGIVTLIVAELSIAHVLIATTDVSSLRNAGGAIGWLLGAPLSRMTTDVVSVLILLTVMFCAVLLITGNNPVELYRRISAWANGVSASARRASRHNEIDESEFEDDDRRGPEFYDISLDEEFGSRHEEAEERPRRERKKRKERREAPAPSPAPSLTPTAKQVLKAEPQQMPLGPGAQPSVWSLPNLDLLTVTRHEKADERLVRDRGELLVNALKEHNVETELVGYTRGPTVTRYELSLGGGVKVAKVTSLSKDIAYTMAATDVRILAPIPGKSAIGIEVPNAQRELVSLGDLMVSSEARSAMHPLDVGVGKDIAGRSVFLNISTTPHMLIAGTTGAGKSSAINCIITSILMRSTPDQVRLILIDPKQVEMAQYARLPHLLTPPVTNPKKAANALGWAVKEMERRYDLLVEAGFRDIVGYNAAYDRGDLNEESVEGSQFARMPYILVVVDELNDLMMVAARDVEECITRIAQKARAVGIHLIVATQRPSVNVITGVIKANIPARMAFAVSSLTDSRVILDQPGAEKLIGKGDMLMLPGNTSVAQRVQSAWVDEGEVRKVVGHWRRQAPEVVYVSGVDGEQSSGSAEGLIGGTTGDSDDDELLRQAMDLVVRTRQGSTSMLQRKLKVGFARAGRLMDLLESRGVVGPSEGSKPREVLMSIEELEALQQAS
ncbi:MAG: DNA translocase FtsK 4TM domain-containing protein [Ilumatobacteraceae bacterium]|jgi:S-DNA-T family DNA segregation ATPase FtsK/SpoIIIE